MQDKISIPTDNIYKFYALFFARSPNFHGIRAHICKSFYK